MKLNLGCGNNKRPNWLNVDKVAACQPDQVVDLEKLPWPWVDDSVDEVLLSHVLEHLGAATDAYLGIIKELYRVCCNNAAITIIVPHPRHDHFLADPTHVRAITPEGFYLLSQKQNRAWMAQGAATTPLAIYLSVDFSIEAVEMRLDEPWLGRLQRGEITTDDVSNAARNYNNVVAEIRILLRTIKPAGRAN